MLLRWGGIMYRGSLTKPAGFYPQVSKPVPFRPIPAGIWALPGSANGYTRGGHTRRMPGYFCSVFSTNSIPIAVYGSGLVNRDANHFIRRCHRYTRKPASHADLRRMPLKRHATRRTIHGASHLVLAMSNWPVTTRRASSRHFWDARV